MTAAQFQKEFVGGESDTVFRQQLTAIDTKNAAKAHKKKKKVLAPIGKGEHDIQTAILNALELVPGGYFWRQNSGVARNTYTNKDGEVKERFWRAGMKGISDILGVYRGYFVAIEVKAKGEKARPEQEEFIRNIRESGGIAFVCDNDDHAIPMLYQYFQYLENKRN